MSAARLRVEGLHRHFDGVVAVDQVTLAVTPGILTAVIGPNGAGKSTLFNMMAGTLTPSGGRIWLDDTEITGWSDQRRARAGMARTFQSARVLQRMTVLENLLVAGADQPGERLGNLLFRRGAVRRRERELRDRAHELLGELKMDHLADQYAAVLSGGQRKLLEFGRLLLTEPRIVLLDEPLAGVNPTLGAQLLERILALRDTGNITFLLIEHDLESVMDHSDHVVVMANGALLTEGTPDEVTNDQRVIDAYLGNRIPRDGDDLRGSDDLRGDGELSEAVDESERSEDEG